MKKLMNLAKAFRDEESGAAMVEYSILVGIIAGAAILIIVGIGLWVNGRFTGLCNTLNTSGIGSCGAGVGS
ncbi:MAG: Flp family type IVb pilin [Mesorhizobium sp.]|uniref:Flp family type IVb pilin n=1 Tax=unclassified Mesorhizobium TaxID=325217 RepID=UPI000FCB4B68|nr:MULTISPECIES: Flp family type IVb pilin [unclassified Mesorhizobium]RUV20368.1 Flp family type IVb pilin [Mesorhizobium sp. M1A.F.Ca.IN.022.04.1.1]RUV63473.1 Flp family type IVb pilin [Mesorhizobium sp. M1A.F.Ca.IN.022.02.1.1]RWG36241.1 MAG: Flp family type IVb pilin [Mesorhizobium sp.]RWH27037.1 MAG: Flp family type IVb pilin [Mesorhizobium sp.]TIM36042.1 MAG: Flp family type IVb pilin [Mesorhizobium sp.]